VDRYSALAETRKVSGGTLVLHAGLLAALERTRISE
jgi:hypothetical protein